LDITITVLHSYVWPSYHTEHYHMYTTHCHLDNIYETTSHRSLHSLSKQWL